MKKGETATVASVNVDGAAGERLNALGVRAGNRITVLAYSVFNSSVLIAVGYNRLAIRKSVAVRIAVLADAEAAV